MNIHRYLIFNAESSTKVISGRNHYLLTATSPNATVTTDPLNEKLSVSTTVEKEKDEIIVPVPFWPLGTKVREVGRRTVETWCFITPVKDSLQFLQNDEV